MPLSNEKYIDVDGIRTRYFEKGEGEPLILMHGSNFGADLSADCSANFSRNFEGLSHRCRVLALDRLGQGYTDIPKRVEDYTMDGVVAHVAAFIRTLGLRDVHLLGHSRGGYVSCRTTLVHPDLIKTCIIVDSGSLAPGPADATAKVMAGVPEPRLGKEAQRWVLQRYSFGYDHIDDEWLDVLTAVAATPQYKKALAIMENGAPFMAHMAKQKPETHAWLRDKGIGKPTLMIWGKNDPTAKLEYGHELYQMIASRERKAQMHIFNEFGHFTYREHPAAFNEVLFGWMAMNR